MLLDQRPGPEKRGGTRSGKAGTKTASVSGDQKRKRKGTI